MRCDTNPQASVPGSGQGDAHDRYISRSAADPSLGFLGHRRRRRLHSTLDMTSPIDYEQANRPTKPS